MNYIFVSVISVFHQNKPSFFILELNPSIIRAIRLQPNEKGNDDE